MLKKIIVGIVLLLIASYAIALLIPIDPVEQRPGTRLSGDLVEPANVDWSFIDGPKQIYVQTSPWYLLPHSVTTTSWVFEGDYYVPCGWCATKYWPTIVAADPDVVLKIDGKLYERTAVLITDPDERHRVLASLMGHEVADGVEVYRMDPR